MAVWRLSNDLVVGQSRKASLTLGPMVGMRDLSFALGLAFRGSPGRARVRWRAAAGTRGMVRITPTGRGGQP
jgi:hypothetical protein